MDGRAGAVMTDRGNIVKSDETQLLLLNQVKPIYVTFNVPEQDLEQVRKFSQVERPPTVDVIVPPATQPSESGALSFIDNQVDAETGTIRLKGTFQNDDRQLWPGQFVQAILNLTVEPGALVIPTRAIQSGQRGLFVFVLDEPTMTVQMKPVKVRREIGDESVLDEGPSAGQRVVAEGQLRLTPGAKAAIKQTPTTDPAPTTVPSTPVVKAANP
jgi:multidrug efflux system membrane fusion protein